VDARRTRLGLALALIFATLIASASTALTAAPGQAAVPIPRPRPPAAYSLPHPQPQIPRPPRDLFPEVYPSNDPNVYEPTGIDRFGAGATSDVLGSAYADDDDDNGGGLNLGSVGVAGGVVMSLGSLLMWLRRRR
jgi:hypothetical protein